MADKLLLPNFLSNQQCRRLPVPCPIHLWIEIDEKPPSEELHIKTPGCPTIHCKLLEDSKITYNEDSFGIPDRLRCSGDVPTGKIALGPSLR